MRAWRTPKWKLMLDFLNEGRAELYNLETAPAETTNLVNLKDPESQRMRNLLITRIVQRMREIGDMVNLSE